MIDLESMAVAMPEVAGHPNRVEFRGVLTVVDVPSNRAPSGSSGHRVLLTRTAAEQALPSLIGMALDYTPSFDRHDMQRKVGVITSAEIVGRNLEISGYLYGKDFPDVVEEIAKSGRREMPVPSVSAASGAIHAVADSTGEGTRLRASLAVAIERLRALTRKSSKGNAGATLRAEATAITVPGLGMSFEVTGVEVVSKRARIWELTKVTFTGAAILRKSKAAYQDTWIELASTS